MNTQQHHVQSDIALLEARHAELVQALAQHDRRAADTHLRRLIERAQNVTVVIGVPIHARLRWANR